jgi:hypothetical protein
MICPRTAAAATTPTSQQDASIWTNSPKKTGKEDSIRTTMKAKG